jgi:hypothetical protein
VSEFCVSSDEYSGSVITDLGERAEKFSAECKVHPLLFLARHIPIHLRAPLTFQVTEIKISWSPLAQVMVLGYVDGVPEGNLDHVVKQT